MQNTKDHLKLNLKVEESRLKNSTIFHGGEIMKNIKKCDPKQCIFAKKGCKPCPECNTVPGKINFSCKTCLKCVLIKDIVRWNDPKTEESLESNQIKTFLIRQDNFLQLHFELVYEKPVPA